MRLEETAEIQASQDLKFRKTKEKDVLDWKLKTSFVFVAWKRNYSGTSIYRRAKGQARQNMFSITTCRYIEVLFHVNFITGEKKVSYTEDFVIRVSYRSRFHCTHH